MADPAVLDDIELQQQLDEKDQLIRALTDRLEDAAEQLDRVSRSGGNKQGSTGGRSSGGGASAELLAGQQSIIEHLEKSAELWEDVQPRDVFARMEEQLSELRRLLESSNVSRPSAATAPREAAAPPAASRAAAAPQPAEAPKANALSGWEKMKAELMGETPAEPKVASSPAPTPAPSAPVPAAPTPVAEVTPHAPPTLVEPMNSLKDLQLPEPVDFETAERSDLEAAIETRDRFIGELSRRLRSADSRTHQTIDWGALNNAPAELKETLGNLEAELNDKLRIAEVDLSLERARLARVEARVHAMQKQFEDKLKAAGPLQDAGPRRPEESASKPTASKSWFGSLGR